VQLIGWQKRTLRINNFGSIDSRNDKRDGIGGVVVLKKFDFLRKALGEWRVVLMYWGRRV